MVKNIVNLSVIGLFVVRLLTFDWPSSTTDVLHLASTVLISIAAGVALSNLLYNRKENSSETKRDQAL